MTFKTLMASAAIATLPFTAFADDSAANKELVLEALQTLMLDGNVEEVSKYYADDIIQHNAMFADSIESQTGVFAMLSGNEGFDAEFVRVIADDDIVAVHARYEGFGPTAMIAFDVFRVEDGKIVEHWDNLIPEAAPNPSGRTQTDGATEITDLDQTEANKAKVEDFITRSMIKHED